MVTFSIEFLSNSNCFSCQKGIERPVFPRSYHAEHRGKFLVIGVSAAQLHPSVSGASVVLLMPLTHN
ncbi:hypothetical protein FQN60_014241 [Etheostoma spectabile]|uniref:Uncharacterized protein n=1 Tax=Etheostoma spectabile TaxID=54343 RepID=A0A5J5D8A9_9PERO|nr:hypothetical protein FQN60_014241 [Etheostoma spectabile]